MSKPKRARLTNLILDEISLVDDPANADATVALYKRNGANPMTDAEKTMMQSFMDKGMDEEAARTRVMRMRKDAGSSGEPQDDVETNMDPKELAKKLEDLEKQVDQLTTERDEAVAKAATSEEAAAEAIAKANQTPEETIDFNGQKIAKSAVPAPVLEEIVKLRTERDAEDLRKRAQTEIPNLVGSDDVKGKILKAVSGIEGALEVLKGANEAAKMAVDERGFTAAVETDAMTELTKMADDYAATHNVTKGAAWAKVTESGRGAELFAKRNAN